METNKWVYSTVDHTRLFSHQVSLCSEKRYMKPSEGTNQNPYNSKSQGR